MQTLRDVNRGRYEKIHDPEIASRIASYELASRMQTAAPELIDLSGESASTLEDYGVDRKDPGGGGRGKSGNTQQDFARNCLLARRMVERGVRFINIIYASWDHHSQLDKELKYNAHVVDQPIAALIRDLKQRGLLDETIVVWTGEFGRLPVSQNGKGRDHNRNAFTLLLAGGGFKPGYIYGATDDVGYKAVEGRVSVPDMFATVMHQLLSLIHI